MRIVEEDKTLPKEEEIDGKEREDLSPFARKRERSKKMEQTEERHRSVAEFVLNL